MRQPRGKKRPFHNDRRGKKAGRPSPRPPPRAPAPPPVELPRTPERVKAPAVPNVPLAAEGGRLLWTCREGFENHLFEELAWAGMKPRMLGPALVESAPSRRNPAVTPAFARMGFTVLEAASRVHASARMAEHATRVVESSGGKPLWVQSWNVDAQVAHSLAADAATLGAQLKDALPGAQQVGSAEAARERNALLVQLCLAGGDVAVFGLVSAREALSLAPGGRRRMRREADDLSRAALKLEEALDSLGVPPGKGDVCVDLGASPGGWTQRLVDRGAKVIAVDPALLRDTLQRHPKVTHVKDSAFRFEPEERVDWLFCDMAWRPLEVAALLAKWGRKGWAEQLVANIKLPMKDKNPILWRVRHTLEQDGGWKHLTMRQLYHDRDEVTVTARKY